jgi:hypothetical protein
VVSPLLMLHIFQNSINSVIANFFCESLRVAILTSDTPIFIMTASILHFSIPPERLGHDESIYLDPDVGPTWPLEAQKVMLQDLRHELKEPSKSLMEQLESRGFAVLKNRSDKAGALTAQQEWNAAYLEETKQYEPRSFDSNTVH